MRIHGFRITQQMAKLGRVASEYDFWRFQKYCPPAGWQPNVDVFRFADRYHVIAELAGVGKSGINVDVQGQTLVLRGFREAPDLSNEEKPCTQVLAIEIECGPFERKLEFPERIDADAVAARKENGLLLIDLPLAPGR